MIKKMLTYQTVIVTRIEDKEKYRILKHYRHGLRHNVSGSAHTTTSIISIMLGCQSAHFLYGKLVY